LQVDVLSVPHTSRRLDVSNRSILMPYPLAGAILSRSLRTLIMAALYLRPGPTRRRYRDLCRDGSLRIVGQGAKEDGGWMAEVCLKDPRPLPEKYEALRKSSAFITKNAIDKYLREASPTIARELIRRLKEGQIAFLPDQLEVADDGVYLLLKSGAVKIPGLDPRDFAPGRLRLFSSPQTLRPI
jgi:hypothetical protein